MDVKHLSLAIPMAHFVLTDRKMANRIAELGIDKEWNAAVFSESTIDGLFAELTENKPGVPHLSCFSKGGLPQRRTEPRGFFITTPPRSKFIDLQPTERNNRDLIGAVSRCVRPPRRTSKLPQNHFQRSLRT
jgi:hypothetical protein